MLKKCVYTIAVIFLLIGIYSSTSVAAENAEIKKTVTNYETFTSSNGGEIVLEVTNITLNSSSSYQYKIEYNNLDTQWHSVTNVENDKLTIMLDKSKSDILNILKISNVAYITIQETKEDSTVENLLEDKEIDISLPLSKAFKVGHWSSGYHGIKQIYDIGNIRYKYVKVDNVEIIQGYLDYLRGYEDNSDNIYWGYYIDNLIDNINTSNNMPIDGWETLIGAETTTQPTEEGLYFIWIKGSQSQENKEVIGCVFSKRFSDISVLEQQLLDAQNDNEDNKTDNTTHNNTTDNKTQEDNTTAKDILPETGISIAVIVVLLVIIFISIHGYKKYNNDKYKDI